MSSITIDQTYRVNESNGIEAYRVVIRGAQPREVRLPDLANEPGAVGVTTHSQGVNGKLISVRRFGVAEVIAAGPVSAGQSVAVAGASGKVKAVPRPQFEFGESGDDNAILIEWLAPELYSAATTISLLEGGPGMSWTLLSGSLNLLLAGNGGEITQTAAELIAAVEADAQLSRLIKVANAPGSTGAGPLETQNNSAANLADLLHPIGIAEDDAVQDGDRIRVMLIPSLV